MLLPPLRPPPQNRERGVMLMRLLLPQLFFPILTPVFSVVFMLLPLVPSLLTLLMLLLLLLPPMLPLLLLLHMPLLLLPLLLPLLPVRLFSPPLSLTLATLSPTVWTKLL